MAGRSNVSRQVALDHILRRLMQQNPRPTVGTQLWSGIARLLPGLTPQQVMVRWQELWEQAGLDELGSKQLEAMGRPISSQPRKIVPSKILQTQSTSSMVQTSGPEQTGSREEKESGGAQPPLGMERPLSHQSSLGSFKSPSCPAVTMAKCVDYTPPSDKATPPSDKATPTITIHVCDDGKNVQKDFLCPPDILMSSMQYFTDYISQQSQGTAEGWSEMDISVHCDITIFTWLMEYVKVGLYEDPFGVKMDTPQHKPIMSVGNVVPILISSDFLRIKKLVKECLDYLHDNLTELLATRCNMSCLRDGLVVQLANRFTPLELEKVKDRRDRFKNKLFLKKLLELTDLDVVSAYCPYKAASLFKCLHCKKLLTTEQVAIFPCIQSRVSMTNRGELLYTHERDIYWELNSYIIQCIKLGQSTRDIYWMLWGVINHLTCQRCGSVFQCRDYHQCAHHPIAATPQIGVAGGRVHTCCNKKVAGFTLYLQKQDGCTIGTHVISSHHGELDVVVDVLIQLDDIICTPNDWLADDQSDYRRSLLNQLIGVPQGGKELTSVLSGPNPVLWSTGQSERLNQDVQREHDLYRLKEIQQKLKELANKETVIL